MAISKEEMMTLLATLKTDIAEDIKVSTDSVNKNIDDKVNMINGRVDKLDQTIKSQCNMIEQHKQEISKLREELEKQEFDLKKNNLILHKIPETEKNINELKQLIIAIISDECRVKLEDFHFENCFRLGKKKSTNANPRPILLSLTSTMMKITILREKKHAKTISISEDMPKHILEKRKPLKPIMESLRKEGKKVYFKLDKLIVNGKPWQESSQSSFEETQKRPRQDETFEIPPAKKPSGTTINGRTFNPNIAPRGAKSIQQKLTNGFITNTNSMLEQTLRPDMHESNRHINT